MGFLSKLTGGSSSNHDPYISGNRNDWDNHPPEAGENFRSGKKDEKKDSKKDSKKKKK